MFPRKHFQPFNGQAGGRAVKPNSLVAQVLGHGDDLRGVKKLILVILVTQVAFARAALICQEGTSRVCSLCYIYQTRHGRPSKHKPHTGTGRKQRERQETRRAEFRLG